MNFIKRQQEKDELHLFSARLRTAMGNHNQDQVADSIGATQSAVSRWLAGLNKPHRRTATMLADNLGVNVEWLLDGKGERLNHESKKAGEQIFRLPARKKFSSEYEVHTKPTANESDGRIKIRWVPVIAWTHAGQATEYEELPAHWQDDSVATECRDSKAFALIVDGDSMEPRCMAGDRVVVMPSEDPRDGCLVVAKLKKDGVILRRFSRVSGGRIRLIAYNPLYQAADYALSEFHWIYPVESTVRKEWS